MYNGDGESSGSITYLTNTLHRMLRLSVCSEGANVNRKQQELREEQRKKEVEGRPMTTKCNTTNMTMARTRTGVERMGQESPPPVNTQAITGIESIFKSFYLFQLTQTLLISYIGGAAAATRMMTRTNEIARTTLTIERRTRKKYKRSNEEHERTNK